MMTVAEIQRALLARGYDPGPIDGLPGKKTEAAVRAFQRGAGLTVDGDPGPKTQAALQAGRARPASPAPASVPADPAYALVPAWLPNAKMERIIVHWTAGPHKATGLDRSHYHLIIQGDGTLVRGDRSIADNEAPIRGAYAAHTLGCNSGSIGVSLACMAGAVERPFSAGSAPMTRTQWDRLPAVLAALCGRYGIPVTPRTVLSHAEVQETLGIKQRGKWDIARLAFDPSVIGAKVCGDLFRARAAALLADSARARSGVSDA